MSSQSCLLDSLWTENWNAKLNEWQAPERIHYSYKDTLLVIKTYPDGVPRRIVYEYDSEDRLTKRIDQFLNEDNSWIDQNIITYSGYNSFGDYTKEVYESLNLGEVIRVRRDCKSYDDYGHLTERIREAVFDGEVQSSYTETYENSYYSDSLLESVIEITWNNETNEMLGKKRTIFEYDDEGRLLVETQERWSEELENFNQGVRTVYDYDEELLFRESRYYSWFSPQVFDLDELVQYFYNEEEQLTSKEILQFGFGQKVTDHYRYVYSYDPCGPVKKNIFTYRDFITNEWLPIRNKTYFYSQHTATSNYETIAKRIYPNPVSARLHLEREDTDNINVDIFTMDGKLMLRYETVGSYIDVNKLETGSYMLHMSSGTAVQAIKFLKL